MKTARTLAEAMAIGTHTAGPWTVVDRFNNDDHDDKLCGIEGGGDEFIIAEVCGDVPDCNRNAHLIAAAPDLLAELRKIFASQNCICKLIPFIGEKPPCETCKLGMLIAKAEGKP